MVAGAVVVVAELPVRLLELLQMDRALVGRSAVTERQQVEGLQKDHECFAALALEPEHLPVGKTQSRANQQLLGQIRALLLPSALPLALLQDDQIPGNERVSCELGDLPPFVELPRMVHLGVVLVKMHSSTLQELRQLDLWEAD